MEHIVKIEGVCKKHGSKQILEDISFTARSGRITAFLGPNGAGKSSTLRILLGLDRATSGTATFDGQTYQSMTYPLRTVGAAFDGIGGLPNRKVYDHLRIIAASNAISKSRINEVLEMTGIAHKRKDLLSSLSLGESQRLGLAAALLGDPQFLILDEPTNGLDPLMQKKLFNILIEEKEKGNTVFLSSHNLVEVQNLCDRVCVIKEGKIVDIIEIEKSKTELKLKVTLSSSDITDDIVLNLSDKILDKNGKLYTFIYSKNIDSLVKELANYKIDELLIKKENLEEAFLNYYENNKEEF